MQKLNAVRRYKPYVDNRHLFIGGGIKRPTVSKGKKVKMAVRRKKNYTMKKLDTPKRVTLPNGRTFTARYRRAKGSELPGHICMNRTYRNRAAVGRRRVRRRQVQSGSGVLDKVKKIAKHPLFKQAIRTGAKHLPSVYNKGTSKIKNQKLRKALQSDLAKSIVSGISNQATKFASSDKETSV